MKTESIWLYRASNDFIQDNTPLFVRGFVFNEILGKLLTVIETMGLSDKQENAIKSYVRQAVWSTLDGNIFRLSEEMDNKICEPLAAQAENTPAKSE